MTVFEFVFIGVLIILACVLFSLFGFTVATRAAMMIGMGLAGLLLIAVATLKIEECPVATIGTFLCVRLAAEVPIKIYNCLDKHFDKEISKRVHVETDEQHTTVESSDWV